MQHLPDELILQIITFLEPAELVNLSRVSRQFLNLSRDNKLWKQLCFSHSYTERRRRRLEITFTSPPAEADPRLAELIEAANSLADSFDITVHNPRAPGAEAQLNRNKERRRAALLSNWDPSGIDEKVDWYHEFVQRHAPPQLSWFEDAGPDDERRREATGAGILYDADGRAEKLIAPLDDGSIRIWDANARSSRIGRSEATSKTALLTAGVSEQASRTIMTDTGAIECVSIDSTSQHGFFAVQQTLHQVDLHTLQLVSSRTFPFPVTALSSAHPTTPLTVGTNWTLHLHDPRGPAPSSSVELSNLHPNFARLLSGDTPRHVFLAQPGALSITHVPDSLGDPNGNIWVSGRFTSLLNFDRRFFPRLRGTVHTRSRISSLSLLPTPFIPQTLRLGAPYASPGLLHSARSTHGLTLLGAGEYKGKGSLELYSLSPDPEYTINSSDTRTTRNANACYQNRQTASASKLLCATGHGTRIVYSDGDGGLKWVERDACTPVRQVNINDLSSPTATSPSPPTSPSTSTAPSNDNPRDDIIQRILPTTTPDSQTTADLLLWTGDGTLAHLSFTPDKLFDRDTFHDALEQQVDHDGESGRLRARENGYIAEMRRALEAQAREVRWLRGYGL